MKMPIANRELLRSLTGENLKITDLVVKKDGSIRATKPKVDKLNPFTGKAAYVWRMVCFMVSPKPAHMYIPCTADFDLPAYDENGNWRSPIAREMAKPLDEVVNVIVDAVKKSEWHGVHRWSRAFGR